MRPDASENSQISPSTIVRAARAAGSPSNLASVLLQGRKSANIYASSGVIRGIPDKTANPVITAPMVQLGNSQRERFEDSANTIKREFGDKYWLAIWFADYSI